MIAYMIADIKLLLTWADACIATQRANRGEGGAPHGALHPTPKTELEHGVVQGYLAYKNPFPP